MNENIKSFLQFKSDISHTSY